MGMAMCGPSPTASRSNIVDYTGYRCRKCGELKWQIGNVLNVVD